MSLRNTNSSDSLASIESFASTSRTCSTSKSCDSFSELIENTTKLNMKNEETISLPLKKRHKFIPIKKRRQREIKQVISKSPQVEDALKHIYIENKKFYIVDNRSN